MSGYKCERIDQVSNEKELTTPPPVVHIAGHDFMQEPEPTADDPQKKIERRLLTSSCRTQTKNCTTRTRMSQRKTDVLAVCFLI